MSLSLCPWHLKAVQPAFCVASSRQSQVIDGPSNNLYESIKCLGKMKETPGSFWHLSLTLLGRRIMPVAMRNLTRAGFCSWGMWMNPLVSNRAGYFQLTARFVPQFPCCKGGTLEVVGAGGIAAVDLWRDPCGWAGLAQDGLFSLNEKMTC